MGQTSISPLCAPLGKTMSQIHKQMHTYAHKERESCETVWLKSFILRHTWMDRWRCRTLMHSPAESSESGSPSPRVSGPTCPGWGQQSGGKWRRPSPIILKWPSCAVPHSRFLFSRSFHLPSSPPPPPPPHPPQEQFEFALTAVAEEVNAILKALPQ